MYNLVFYNLLSIYLLVFLFSGLVWFFFYSAFAFYFFSIVYFLIFFTLLLAKFSFFVFAESSVFQWALLPDEVNIFFWTDSNPLAVDFSLLLIFLTLNIHFYTYYYFKKDPELARFSLLLGFFVFSMLLMISSTSLVFLFIAWEGVGLFSFLLVSFWYSKVSTFKSGAKVLFYNRLGDFFFFISIGLFLSVFKTDHILPIINLFEFIGTESWSFQSIITLKALLTFSLTLVILSKSAQYGFHIWLLEAMEAPLPASSLIHSATLICSGVVLFFKTSELILSQSEVSALILVWASLTSCCLSFSAFYNYDIKRVLAYSTGSHVSVMLGLAVTYNSYSGYLYMLIHASTKVFIFILFGYLIDVNGGVRDLRKMGGFFFRQDLFSYCIWGLLLLSATPLFLLPFIKDSLLLRLPAPSFISEISIMLFMLSSLFNYFYSVRLFFKIFFGDKLSIVKTYFSSLTFYKNNILLVKKSFLSRNYTNPLLFLFFYILLFESNLLPLLDFNLLNAPYNFFFVTSAFVTQPALKYYALSFSFFYFIIIFFLFKFFA